ncbi:MAG: response regulator transcription factor [Candidatus Methylomirabilales bacterium]
MKPGRVLVADRHRNMLEGIRDLLETMFPVVVMVTDDESLFESVDMFNPGLAVVDLSLPVSKDGNIARRLKSRNPELKVILLSVYDEPAVVKEALASGAVGFVLKRSVATDLIPAVREVLQGRTYVSPAVRDHEGRTP